MRDILLNAAGERVWDAYGRRRLNDLRAAHGLAPVSHLFDQIRRARRHFVLTSRAFDFPAALPANVRYVGPVFDDPVWAETVAWTAPPGTDPLVLVAMSSTYQDQLGCLQRVVDALGTLRVRGLVTTGPAIDATALRAGPNVTVVPAAPHHQVLRQAALVVTHGGHGTVLKALAAGVPLVLLPHGRDQDDNAVRVTERGAGVKLSRTAPAVSIATAVRTILAASSYRTAAEALARALRDDTGGDVLIRELEAIPAPEQRTTENGYATGLTRNGRF
jgi:MGT family glycosyltransferase